MAITIRVIFNLNQGGIKVCQMGNISYRDPNSKCSQVSQQSADSKQGPALQHRPDEWGRNLGPIIHVDHISNPRGLNDSCVFKLLSEKLLQFEAVYRKGEVGHVINFPVNMKYVMLSIRILSVIMLCHDVIR